MATLHLFWRFYGGGVPERFFCLKTDPIFFCWSGQTYARAEDTKAQKHMQNQNTRDRWQAVICEVQAVDGPGGGASGVVSSDAVVPSAGVRSAIRGGGAAATPAADGRVAPQRGGLGATRLRSGNGTPVTVTIVPQTSGKSAERSWVWQVFHEFAPANTEKNVFCQVCKHLLKWKAQAGTRGMSEHKKKNHRRHYDELMNDHTTLDEGRESQDRRSHP